MKTDLYANTLPESSSYRPYLSDDDDCRVPAPFPIKVEGAVGTYIDGKIMVCGGRSSFEDYSKRCFNYDNGKNEWEEADAMNDPRFQVNFAFKLSNLLSRLKTERKLTEQAKNAWCFR